jgi:hypothetical protein
VLQPAIAKSVLEKPFEGVLRKPTRHVCSVKGILDDVIHLCRSRVLLPPHLSPRSAATMREEREEK